MTYANPSVLFDESLTGVVVGASTTLDRQLDVRQIRSGIVEALQVALSTGSSSNMTIELWDDDPSTGGCVYQVLNHDLDTAALDDRNCFFIEFVTELWLRLINGSGTSATLAIRFRFKGDTEAGIGEP